MNLGEIGIANAVQAPVNHGFMVNELKGERDESWLQDTEMNGPSVTNLASSEMCFLSETFVERSGSMRRKLPLSSVT